MDRQGDLQPNVDIAHSAAIIADKRMGHTEIGRKLLSDVYAGKEFLDLAETLVNVQEKVNLDEKTQLLNETGFSIALNHLVNTIIRDADVPDEDPCLLVVKLDIRFFKVFNDIFSWNQGDEVLINLANKLFGTNENAPFRKIDVLSRLGGDDFALAFWLTHDRKNGQQDVVDAVQSDGGVIDRLKNIGQELNVETHNLYSGVYDQTKNEDPNKVRKALRLGESDPLPDWSQVQVGGLSMAGVFFTKADLMALENQVHKLRGNWWKLLSPNFDGLIDRSKTTGKFVGEKFNLPKDSGQENTQNTVNQGGDEGGDGGLTTKGNDQENQ